MAVNVKYDVVTLVEIGRTPADHVNITNVVSFADRIVSPDGLMVDPLSVINTFNPGGVHQNHKYWEMELVLDTNWLPSDAAPTAYWEYTQNVDLANATPAIVDAGANPDIEYFIVTIREHDGTVTTLTYADEETNQVWCVGKVTEISNEKDVRHQTTTFRFICLTERVKSHA
jgi:hypothetical protein